MYSMLRAQDKLSLSLLNISMDILKFSYILENPKSANSWKAKLNNINRLTRAVPQPLLVFFYYRLNFSKGGDELVIFYFGCIMVVYHLSAFLSCLMYLKYGGLFIYSKLDVIL